MYKTQTLLVQQVKRVFNLVNVARTMSSQPNVYVTRPDVDISGLELLRKR